MNTETLRFECLKLVMENGSNRDREEPLKQAQILIDFVKGDKAKAPPKNKGGRPRKR